MVTKKTRLMSVVAVVLMLVSMFTTFVLPASADDALPVFDASKDAYFNSPKDYNAPRAKDHATYAYADYNDWIVANSDDWRGIVEMGKANNFSGKTIHLVQNINMNDDHVDSVKTAFAGTLNGHDFVFQNFKMEVKVTAAANVGLFASTSGATFANVGIENGLIKVTGTTGKNYNEVKLGAFAGVSEGSNASTGSSFYKCWNGADITADLTLGSVSLAGIARMKYGTVVNCYNTGTLTAKTDNGSVYANGLGDNVANSTFYNVFSAGTLVAEGTTARTAAFRCNNGASGTKNNKAANLYAIGHDAILYLGTDTGAKTYVANLINAQPTVAADAYTTGELAWSLNKNYEDSKDTAAYPKVYYTMKDGKAAFGEEGNQTRKVTLTRGEQESVYMYVNAGETVEVPANEVYVLEACSVEGYTYDDNGLSFTMPAEDVTVTYKQIGIDYGALDRAVAHWNSLNPLYFTNGEALKTALEEIADKRANGTFENQAEVNEYTDLLNSFAGKYAAYPNLPLASEIETYSDAKEFRIAGIEDMNYVAENSTAFTAEMVLHFDVEGNEITVPDGALANDWSGVNAAIDGHGVTIIGVDYVGSRDANTAGDAWLGNYAGAYLKNITFKDWTATTLGFQGAVVVSRVEASTEFANLHFINCTATKQNGNGMGILAGIQQSNYQATFTDISFEGCTLDTNGRSSSSNIAFLIGRVSAGEITANKIYLNNNKYTCRGENKHGGRGVVIGECAGATATFTDIGVFNTTYKGTATIKGLIGGRVKSGATVTYANIITGNNGNYPMVWSEGTVNLTFTNVYTDAPYMEDGATQIAGNITTEQIMNGYAAVQLNAVSGSAKWEILPNATAPSFDTDGKGLPYTITFIATDYLDTTEDFVAYRYTNAAGTLLGLDDELMNAAIWPSKEDLLAMVFTTNSTVSGTPWPAHECIWGNLVHIENTASHTAECIWEGNGVACPKTATLDCEFTNLTPVDLNAEPANATHSGTCACGAVGNVIPCELTTFTVAPTCEDPGSVTYICDCGYIHTDLTDPLDHDWSAWVADEVEEGAEHTHSRECANGGEIQTEACTYNGEWVEEKAPSATEPGLQKKTCDEACGSYITQVIPVLAHFELEAETGILGKEMNVKVNLKNSTGVAGTKLTVTYDPTAVTFVGADKGDWTENTLVFGGPVSEVDANGNVTVIVNFVSPANMVGDGTLVNLAFAVAEDAAPGEYDIAVSAEGKDAVDKNAVPVPVAAATGKLEIVDHVNGDISGDGAVSIIDAVLMLRYACGDDMTGVELDLEAADITGEGEVMMDDVVLVLRYLNGTIANL